MRTTVDIDDDVLSAARDRARREGSSIGKVLSQLARQGLVQSARETSPGRGRHGFRPLASRGGVVSNELIDRLREDEPE